MILFEFIIQINSVNVVLECHIHLYILLLYSTVKSDDNLNEAKREKKPCMYDTSVLVIVNTGIYLFQYNNSRFYEDSSRLKCTTRQCISQYDKNAW